MSRQHGLRTTYLAEEAGSILAAVTWMGFGALAISKVLSDITWRVVLYAVLSLTVVRMLPAAIAMVRTGARWPTVAFMRWFGPHGLASVVFGLLAFGTRRPRLTHPADHGGCDRGPECVRPWPDATHLSPPTNP